MSPETIRRIRPLCKKKSFRKFAIRYVFEHKLACTPINASQWQHDMRGFCAWQWVQFFSAPWYLHTSLCGCTRHVALTNVTTFSVELDVTLRPRLRFFSKLLLWRCSTRHNLGHYVRRHTTGTIYSVCRIRMLEKSTHIIYVHLHNVQTMCIFFSHEALSFCIGRF